PGAVLPNDAPPFADTDRPLEVFEQDGFVFRIHGRDAHATGGEPYGQLLARDDHVAAPLGVTEAGFHSLIVLWRLDLAFDQAVHQLQPATRLRGPLRVHESADVLVHFRDLVRLSPGDFCLALFVQGAQLQVLREVAGPRSNREVAQLKNPL